MNAALLFACCLLACGPSPAYEPARPTAAEARCRREDRIHISARGLHNGTDRPDADIARLVAAAFEKHLSGRYDVVLTQGAHIDGRCELDLAITLMPIEHPAGKVVVRGTASVVENGSRAKRGGDEKQASADASADVKAIEDLLLAKTIDLLVGTVVANIRAIAGGDPDAVPTPLR